MFTGTIYLISGLKLPKISIMISLNSGWLLSLSLSSSSRATFQLLPFVDYVRKYSNQLEFQQHSPINYNVLLEIREALCSFRFVYQ